MKSIWKNLISVQNSSFMMMWTGFFPVWTGFFLLWTGFFVVWTGFFLLWTGFFPVWTGFFPVWTGFYDVWTGFFGVWTGFFGVWTSFFGVFLRQYDIKILKRSCKTVCLLWKCSFMIINFRILTKKASRICEALVCLCVAILITLWQLVLYILA